MNPELKSTPRTEGTTSARATLQAPGLRDDSNGVRSPPQEHQRGIESSRRRCLGLLYLSPRPEGHGLLSPGRKPGRAEPRVCCSLPDEGVAFSDPSVLQCRDRILFHPLLHRPISPETHSQCVPLKPFKGLFLPLIEQRVINGVQYSKIDLM